MTSPPTPNDLLPPLVLVFLKAPRSGTVKTRLARAVGPARALRVYRNLAEGQLRRLPPDWTAWVCYAPRGSRGAMRAWLGARWRLRVQRGADLGARLTRAFEQAFATGARRVLAIGADCPALDAARLVAAARALERSDVVLGPARDGGYYLIGLQRPAPVLFGDIPWGADGVLQATRRRARAAGLRVRLLEMLEDVDDLASWRQSMAER